jgi:hypothetical protein
MAFGGYLNHYFTTFFYIPKGLGQRSLQTNDGGWLANLV